MAANDSYAGKNTSLITILSSEHGRLRREQRDIDKRDLQRALKYGKREKVWSSRWQVEYDGITFITDPTMGREITAYPSPLPDADVDSKTIEENNTLKRLIQQKPELSTSHTIIVIDNSGSMLSKKNDVLLYRDSQNAAFSMTALEFVAEQLFSNTAVNSDLVSLVKFGDQPSIEFSREPISWLVYNRILAHRNTQRYVDRKNAPLMDELTGGSNYLPALEKVHQLLKSGYHDQLALSVYFFSDGKSTDHMELGVPVDESYKLMKDAITSIASSFGDALTVSMVGLGDVNDQFEPLKAMADAAMTSGAKGSFERCDKTANSISSSISSMVTSTMETRVTLQEGGRGGFTERSNLTSEKKSFPKCKWNYFKILDHLVYNPQEKKLLYASALPLAAVQLNSTEASERMADPPPHIAINCNYVGMGAERVAFRCRLSYEENTKGFVFQDMVAKETKHDQRIAERVAFHTGFTETQDFASYLASEFNKRLRGIPSYSPSSTPKLCFLSCSVLLLKDSSWPTGERGVLVEKMLDTDRFRWTKWNDNNGSVLGQKRAHNPIDVDFEVKELQRETNHKLGALEECDEDSDDDDSVSDVESDSGDKYVGVNPHNNNGIDPSDYLRELQNDYVVRKFVCLSSNDSNVYPPFNPAEAFTHFTYRFTNYKVMVCDLQGVFNTGMIPPTIELTDPAIHYASTKGRRMVYGRTDKGRSGMNAFFKSHKCTEICKMLHLSARNKEWSCDWRRESTQDTNFR